MRAIVVSRHGGPEVLEAVEVEAPKPGPGELLVDVSAAGVNFKDVYERTGLYPLPEGSVLGSEGAGHVAALGEGVTGFSVGDSVAWTDAPGSYAEQVIVPADRAVPVPEGVSIETAAAAMLQGITAQYLTQTTYPIAAGETALIHAAAGGTGLLLTQFVKATGGKVIATVSTEEKEKVAREAGADEIVRYRGLSSEELAAEVRRLNGGEGVDVVYDGVGADTFDASLASLRPRGMLVSFGNSSGPVAPLNILRLMSAGSVYLTRPTLVHHIATHEDLVERSADLFRRIRNGSLKVQVGATYPLADTAQAHRDLEARKTTAKLLLIP
jgi:NADPH2:quinone reductase